MINRLTITIVVDNKSEKTNLLSEHGLSFWIEADEHRILFDTGQSNILSENARQLGIDLSTADALVLSHGHYDHTGGAALVLQCDQPIELYCHSGIFVPRYSRQSDGTMKPIGINFETSKALTDIIDSIHWVNEPVFISNDIGITGPIPRKSGFEDTGGSFYLDPEATNPDRIIDDLALWLRTTNGIVVVTGCCHSGIVNTLEHIKTISGHSTILAVVGGLHLLNASSERLKSTCEYLKRVVQGKIYPCHCTGDNAIDFLRAEFGDKIKAGSIGITGIPEHYY
jgi:7,8-dihydropterin-6-yl-methyl-4-(beta-D-ribofuranosyl)aminobenzene 5'-phosphate synthase